MEFLYGVELLLKGAAELLGISVGWVIFILITAFLCAIFYQIVFGKWDREQHKKKVDALIKSGKPYRDYLRYFFWGLVIVTAVLCAAISVWALYG